MLDHPFVKATEVEYKTFLGKDQKIRNKSRKLDKEIAYLTTE
jgi:hypothetical protein